jgi:hypothetical protein
MAKQLGEDTKVTLDLKTLGMIATGIAALVGMWFALQADKDELIRQTIMDTQDDVDKILEELEKIDERLYELQKK